MIRDRNPMAVAMKLKSLNSFDAANKLLNGWPYSGIPVLLVQSMLEAEYTLSAIEVVLRNLHEGHWEPIEGMFPLHLNAHRSEKDKNLIAYTVPIKVPPYIRNVSAKPGKFFKKHMTWLSDSEVQEMVDEFTIDTSSENIKHFLGNIPEGEAVRIYTNPFPGREVYCQDNSLPTVTGSCMGYPARFFADRGYGFESQHPVCVYEMTPDVGIVWIEKEGMTVARALLNMTNKTICRVYTSGCSVEEARSNRDVVFQRAKQLGFESKSNSGLDGCRLRFVPAKKRPSDYCMMPYLDGQKGLNLIPDRSWFVVDEKGGFSIAEWSTGNVVISGAKVCDHCGILSRYVYDIKSKTYCSNCAENVSSICNHCRLRVPTEAIQYLSGTGFCNECVKNLSEECSECGKVSLARAFVEVDSKILCSCCAVKKAGDIGKRFLIGDIVYCDGLNSFGRVISDATSFASQYYDHEFPIVVRFAEDEYGCNVIRKYGRNGLVCDHQSSDSIVFFMRRGARLLA